MVTPESLLLKRIEEELIVISESQHVQARQVAILRKARTLLHVGCSTIEVNAVLAEHLRKERAQGASSARTRPVRKLQLRAPHAQRSREIPASSAPARPWHAVTDSPAP